MPTEQSKYVCILTVAVWKLELPLPKLGTNCPNFSLQSDGFNERTGYHILNEIAIMVTKNNNDDDNDDNDN